MKHLCKALACAAAIQLQLPAVAQISYGGGQQSVTWSGDCSTVLVFKNDTGVTLADMWFELEGTGAQTPEIQAIEVHDANGNKDWDVDDDEDGDDDDDGTNGVENDDSDSTPTTNDGKHRTQARTDNDVIPAGANFTIRLCGQNNASLEGKKVLMWGTTKGPNNGVPPPGGDNGYKIAAPPKKVEKEQKSSRIDVPNQPVPPGLPGFSCGLANIDPSLSFSSLALRPLQGDVVVTDAWLDVPSTFDPSTGTLTFAPVAPGQSVQLYFDLSQLTSLAPETSVAIDVEFPHYFERFEDHPASPGGSVFTPGGAYNLGSWKQWDGAPNEDALVFLGGPVPAHGGTRCLGTQLGADTIRTFESFSSGHWDLRIWSYVPGPASPSPMQQSQWLVLLDVYDDFGPYEWATQLEFDPVTGQVIADIGYSLSTGQPQWGSSAPLVFDAWIEVRIEVDVSSDQAHVFYDGQPIGDPFQWSRGPFGNNTSGTQPDIRCIDLYAGGTTSPQSFLFWDDLSITPHAVSPTSYCTPSTTTSSCTPTLTSSGTPSASASSGFQLTCVSVEGQKSGLLFFGVGGRTAINWGTGSTSYLCVKAPQQRTPPQSSGGAINACNGVLSVDFLAFMASNPGALGQPIHAGQQFNAQAWFRDPPAPKTTNLSDAVEFWLMP